MLQSPASGTGVGVGSEAVGEGVAVAERSGVALGSRVLGRRHCRS